MILEKKERPKLKKETKENKDNKDEVLILRGKKIIKEILKVELVINYDLMYSFLDKDIYNQSKLRHQCTNYVELTNKFNERWAAIGGILKGKEYNKLRDSIKNQINEFLYRLSILYFKKEA